MTGIYQHTLDAKGRLFIPAKLREELGETFYVTISPEKCLSAYSQENWKGISEKAAAMSNVQQRKVRPLFAYAARCDLDGQGDEVNEKDAAAIAIHIHICLNCRSTCMNLRVSPRASPWSAATTTRNSGTARAGTRSARLRRCRRTSPP